ncbi:MAG: S-layer homology domain-containing protein [Defluviitaleaceae bacterium]|nr:S-layer homology domain-containing protein [Defluviitaleaceae bacterium]
MAQAFWNLSFDPERYGQEFFGFSDVGYDGWYFEAISFFANIDVLQGFPDGTFRPNNHITNAEFAAFAVMAFNLYRLGIYNIVPYIEGHWAEAYINIGFDIGWFDYFGRDYVFVSNAPITRAQAVTLTNHFTGRVPNPYYIEQYLAGRQLFIDFDRSHWSFYQIMEAVISHVFILNEDYTESWLEAESVVSAWGLQPQADRLLVVYDKRVKRKIVVWKRSK